MSGGHPRTSKLPATVKGLICELLAEYEGPAGIIRAVSQAHGLEITRATVAHYQTSEHWQSVVQDKRKALDLQLDTVPISSRWWRAQERMKLLAQARTGDKPDLGTARGLLTDAAREMGHAQPDQDDAPRIGSINLTLVNQVLQLPEAAQEAYIRTGKLPPATYLTDLSTDPPQPALSPAPPITCEPETSKP